MAIDQAKAPDSSEFIGISVYIGHLLLLIGVSARGSA
jgi:hypothetical protein